MATEHTGLQAYAKILQMHLPGIGGISWLQPKSCITFELASNYFLKVLAVGFLSKNFIIVVTVPTGLQTCDKVL